MIEIAHTGHCLCGTVRWRAAGIPINVNYCHCEMCRRGSGAPVVAWATFPIKDVSFSSEPAWRRSSDHARRAFCAACGSALAWHGDRHPDLLDLTVGTADNPDALGSREHLWTESAVRWLQIKDELPRHTRERGS